MDFFNSAVDVLQTLVIALGAGLCLWGGINLLEGYGQDNPASKSTRIITKHKKETKNTMVWQSNGIHGKATQHKNAGSVYPAFLC